MTKARDLSVVPNQSLGFKNRLINGDCRIDQRNNGASTTPTANGYSIDRWFHAISQASKFSIQRNAGSVTPPPGYTNYLGVTSLSAYSVISTDFFQIEQRIEGFNCADLGFGTANASPVTVSFWVRSSLTGTFAGNLANQGGNRWYPFNYTITAANTWELKTITVPGDTAGTWQTDNGTGLRVVFVLGYGSTINGTVGSWGSSGGGAGATSVVGTNGATFYVTGVQLEKGSTATSFDYRPYGTELSLCYRYFQKSTEYQWLFNIDSNNSYRRATVVFKNSMRATPTINNISISGNGAGSYGTQFVGVNNFTVYMDLSSGSYFELRDWNASAEL